MARITLKTSGCDNKTCPAIYATDDPELTAIQIRLPQPGDDLAVAGEVPAHEGIGFIPTALLRAWASGQQ